MAANNRYSGFSDEELIHMLRDGDNSITDYLCEKYKNLVKNKARTMYILGAEPEDLIQEGMIGLFKAVRDYDSGRDASFQTFAELCISRQMYTAIQNSNRQKHMPLNTYVSLYGSTEYNGETGASLQDELPDNIIPNPEQLLIDKENVEDLEHRIEESLSELERQVLDLHLTGMGYATIARVLGRDEKSTDNALQRIKSKIRRIIATDTKA